MKAFLGAAMLVMVISVALVVTGVVGNGGGSVDVTDGQGPAVLGQTVTPAAAAGTDTPTPGPPVTGPVDVPIMMYHIIGPPDRPGNAALAVSKEDFSAQMQYLDCAGFTPITIGHLFQAFAGETWLPEKPIILTFDDGWEGDYTYGYAVLKQHGFAGSFGIVTGFVEAGGPYMTWAQIKEMADAGMEITSHTVSHPDLGTSDDATVLDQLTTSKAALEEKIGRAVDYLVYPSGEPFRSGTPERQAQVVQMLKDTGYRGALLDDGRYGGQDPSRPYELSRVRVDGGEDLATFAGSIYGPPPSEVRCS